MGRRRANATYFESHGVDVTTGMSYAMDLTPLVFDLVKDIPAFVQEFIQRFEQDVAGRLRRVGYIFLPRYCRMKIPIYLETCIPRNLISPSPYPPSRCRRVEMRTLG